MQLSGIKSMQCKTANTNLRQQKIGVRSQPFHWIAAYGE